MKIDRLQSILTDLTYCDDINMILPIFQKDIVFDGDEIFCCGIHIGNINDDILESMKKIINET